MKKIFLILLILLFTRCTEYFPTQQHLSVIVDLTDVDSEKPSYKEVTSYLKKGHASDGLSLSLRFVSETRYAPTYQFELPIGETGLLSNEDTRRTKRKLLLKQFKDTLEGIQKKLSPRSEIFRVVVDELNRLSTRTGNRTLLLFSNLEEHSFFSVYNKKDVQQLLSQPELVVEQFKSEVNLNDNLSGITLQIIYTPSLEEDRVFTAMIELYQSLLKPRGLVLKVITEKKVLL